MEGEIGLAEAQQYHAGQMVQATLDFLDGESVREVTATFAHEDDVVDKLRLSGVPTQQVASEGGYSYWRVVLTGSISADDKLGTYRCETVEAAYPGGRKVAIVGVPDTGFRIVEEDIPPPEGIGWSWGEPS